jgi:hypothetical protein
MWEECVAWPFRACGHFANPWFATAAFARHTRAMTVNFSARVLTVAHLAGLVFGTAVSRADPLDDLWANPPPASRIRAYWWWLNGNVTRDAITRDLEQMKTKGFGGALIWKAKMGSG